MTVNFRVGIAGLDGTGKSTLARNLVDAIEHFNRGAENDCIAEPLITGFAQALRKDLQTLLRTQFIAFPNLPSLWQKPTPPAYRKLLEGYGQMMRLADPMYWVNQLEFYMQIERVSNWIIDDARYENEVEWVKDEGGVVLFLTPVEEDPTIDKHQLDSVKSMADFVLISDPTKHVYLDPFVVFDLVLEKLENANNLSVK